MGEMMSEQEKKQRKQVEREYIIELLDGTTETVTTTSLLKAKKHAWVMYSQNLKDVRRADGVVSNPGIQRGTMAHANSASKIGATT